MMTMMTKIFMMMIMTMMMTITYKGERHWKEMHWATTKQSHLWTANQSHNDDNFDDDYDDFDGSDEDVRPCLLLAPEVESDACRAAKQTDKHLVIMMMIMMMISVNIMKVMLIIKALRWWWLYEKFLGQLKNF